MNSKELAGMACRIGAAAALELAEFERSLEGMEERQRSILLRGWLAVETLPGDASLERALIRDALAALRMEWLKPIYDSEKDKKVPLSDAVRYMDERWLSQWGCAQTTLDALRQPITPLAAG